MNIDAKESKPYGRKVASGRQQLFKAHVGYRAVMGWMLRSERTTLSSHAREIDPNRRLSLFAGGEQSPFQFPTFLTSSPAASASTQNAEPDPQPIRYSGEPPDGGNAENVGLQQRYEK
jgi:hypothetical protein